MIADSHSDGSEMKSQCHFDFHFLMTKDSKLFFMCLLAICASFEKVNFFACLLIGLFAWCLNFLSFYIFWISIPYQMNSRQRFSSIL
jgi:hypothetical protein